MPGVPGSAELDIPAEMTVDEGKGYEHRIAYLFGNGQWLLDHPTAGMANDFGIVELQMVGVPFLVVSVPLLILPSNKHSHSRCSG